MSTCPLLICFVVLINCCLRRYGEVCFYEYEYEVFLETILYFSFFFSLFYMICKCMDIIHGHVKYLWIQ